MRLVIVLGRFTVVSRPPLEKVTPSIFVPKALKVLRQGHLEASIVPVRFIQLDRLISCNKSLTPRVKVFKFELL